MSAHSILSSIIVDSFINQTKINELNNIATKLSEIDFYQEKIDFLNLHISKKKSRELFLLDMVLNGIQSEETVQKLTESNEEIFKSAILTSSIETRINLKENLNFNYLGKIQGINENGESISVKFKTLTYIDFWATWCKPCLEEIKYTKVLQTNYLNSKRINFLNISFDQNYDVWKKFLIGKPEFLGSHLLFNEEYRKLVKNYFKFEGIPRYMLVSENGTVLNSNMPRPSDPKTLEIINNYLAQ